MPALRAPSSLLGLVVVAGLTTACGARTGVGVSTTSSGPGGATTTSTTFPSSSSSTGGVTSCTDDGDCPASAFCWLDACVKLGAVTSNGYHASALTTAGGVQCWGDDGNGELGNGSTMDSPLPVAVSSLGSGVVTIAAGFKHTCALTAASGVLCWGSNVDGQLGNGSGTDSQVPAAVSGLASGIAAISAGFYHTCALSKAGAVACWGWNENGELGNGTTMDNPVPVAVSGLSSGITAIAAGGGHTCARTTEGGVLCWGDNFYGELGDGSWTESHVPVAVSGLSSGIAAIAAGDGHTCALTTGGGVLCWGRNHRGQLGTGTGTDSWVPVPVPGLSSGVAGIAARGLHTCAWTAGGSALCWGMNDAGQIGNGTTTDSPVPVAVSGLSSGVAAIDTGYEHTCALTTEGGAKCWGSNAHGQLGNGSTMDSLVPVGVVEP